jgi:hypothetical protein
MVERVLVRVLVAVALVLALLASVVVPVPLGEDGDSALPAVAFGQVALYRLEVALLVFYSGLLIATPAFSGLIRGRLPIEISARGAKFAEEASHSTVIHGQKIEDLERTTEDHAVRLATVDLEIKRLRHMKSDNTQPRVNSKQ